MLIWRQVDDTLIESRQQRECVAGPFLERVQACRRAVLASRVAWNRSVRSSGPKGLYMISAASSFIADLRTLALLSSNLPVWPVSHNFVVRCGHNVSMIVNNPWSFVMTAWRLLIRYAANECMFILPQSCRAVTFVKKGAAIKLCEQPTVHRRQCTSVMQLVVE